MSKILHSIIIPHRNRVDNLADCLESIARSAAMSPEPVPSFEVIVVDDIIGIDTDTSGGFCDAMNYHRCFARLCCAMNAPPIFNKPKSLNIGIEAARGRYITFLDADAIVGPLFLASAPLARHFTRLCYRVRYVPADYGRTAEDYHNAFMDYDNLARGYEGYGIVDRNPVKDQCPGNWKPSERFGNSQFTIERKKLGRLRFDEAYAGRGFSDLEFIRRIVRHHGPDYTAGVLTQWQCAMIHRRHEYGDDWETPETTSENRKRYKDDVL
jgi:glycosyltransferase involved in cell wall biosynthesis